MEVIVQKFGGTSVVTEESRLQCISHIKREIGEGKKVVVVVSAMGRKGDSYATDTLLSLVEQEIGDREKDLLLTTGELISATLFSSLLNKEGVPSVVLTGGQAGIVTNDSYGSALILDVVPKRVVEELKMGNVVVIPGFQGVTISGDVTTLGRGGSDTTAAAIAAGLKAQSVDIYTDVQGLMTADPRIVSNARYLDTIPYEDVAQLAHGGATVIHPRAVELAMKHEIPMRIRSTFSDSKGTKVIKKSSKREYDVKEVLISGIVSNNKIHRYIVESSDGNELGSFKELFTFLKGAQISIDFINITSGLVYFSIAESDSNKLNYYLYNSKYKIVIDESIAKISIVGNAINGVPGIMTNIVNTMADANVEILQTADSNTTIWLLINKEDEEKAICNLHRAFFE